jgi:hypothetical protein
MNRLMDGWMNRWNKIDEVAIDRRGGVRGQESEQYVR